jgi:putative oxidoreductase
MTTMIRFVAAPVGSYGAPALVARALNTTGSRSHAALRLTLAAVLLPHGMQHLLGLFGGPGFAGTLGWMTGTLGIPAPLAAAGILVEFVGPGLLVVGIGSRLWGAALAVFMATAAATHATNGFFMNWFGALPAGSEGFEYHLLAIAMAVFVAVNGGGAFSLDRLLANRLGAR